MFGPKMHVCEAPLAIGALIGGGLGAAGIGGLTLLSGVALGSLAGGVIGGLFKGQSSLKAPQDQQQQAAAQTPALPPATQMPAVPMSPTSTPTILNTGAIPQDISTANRPQDAAEASPPTADEIARGELDRKRKGRLSTILTTPQSRLDADSSVGNEKLGG